MTTPQTDRESRARRLLRRLAPRPPAEPVLRRSIGRMFLALWAVFVALYVFSAFESWGQRPLLADLYAAYFALGFGILPMLVTLSPGSKHAAPAVEPHAPILGSRRG